MFSGEEGRSFSGAGVNSEECSNSPCRLKMWLGKKPQEL